MFSSFCNHNRVWCIAYRFGNTFDRSCLMVFYHHFRLCTYIIYSCFGYWPASKENSGVSGFWLHFWLRLNVNLFGFFTVNSDVKKYNLCCISMNMRFSMQIRYSKQILCFKYLMKWNTVMKIILTFSNEKSFSSLLLLWLNKFVQWSFSIRK